MSPQATAAIVGVGATDYYRRGQSLPRTQLELGCLAILAALEDAGLTVDDLDGFSYYTHGADTGLIASTLGVPEVRFTAGITGGGGGSTGSVGLAAMAVTTGMADVVVSLLTLQQARRRFGAAFAPQPGGGGGGGAGGALTYVATPEKDFDVPFGFLGPVHSFAVMARRHMHLYGTTREHFAEVAIAHRVHASNRPKALMREPLTLDDYFSARMIADPLCLFDCTQENDGAVAVITTSLERARDLRHPPVRILGHAHGGAGRWGLALTSMNQPDDMFASSGHRTVAPTVYQRAGVTPADIDVAELYDHFTPMVIMQLEDYGFCDVGEGGPFVASGAIRHGTGSIPVNTHGGNLSEAYLIGMSHVMEAVEQVRGTAINQVQDAELALVTGGPASLPLSGMILGR